MPDDIKRRDFLKSTAATAALAAPGLISAQGANTKINIGWIGVGTQNRSSSLYKKAKELIQQGKIGDVHFVRAFWYRNARPDEPSWRYDIPPEANPQNTDWSAFLGPAQKRAWDPHRYFQWRLYW